MSVIEVITIAASLLAILISVTALYVANFWKGKIHCSNPTQFFLGYSNDEKAKPHVAVHSFIYASGTNGRVIEHMFVEFEQSERKQTFNVWYFGKTVNRTRVGGLRILRDGINLNNLFYPPDGEPDLKFASGKFTLRLFARIAGKDHPQKLNETTLELTDNLVQAIKSGNLAVFDIKSSGTGYYGFSDTFSKD